ncbi:hypothetical protein ABKN59_010731 [Abortiporus biennis]
MTKLTPIILASLQRDQVVNTFSVTTATVLLYDHLLTLGAELTYVWPAKWTLGKVLYILSRYPPYIDIAFVLFHQLAKSPSVSLCHDAFQVAGWANLFGIVITEIVLIMRTWALWGENKWIPISLGSLGVIALAGACFVVEIFLRTITFIFVDDLSPLLRGCFVSGGSKLVYVDFIILIIFETVVLSLTLYIGFKNYRENLYNSSLVTSLFRDGILYYLYLFLFSIVNVIVPLTAPVRQLVMNRLQRVMHSICASHMLLHLRQGLSRRIGRAASFDPSSIGTNFTLDTRFGQARESVVFAHPSRDVSTIDEEDDDDSQFIENTWFGEEDSDASRGVKQEGQEHTESTSRFVGERVGEVGIQMIPVAATV